MENGFSNSCVGVYVCVVCVVDDTCVFPSPRDCICYNCYVRLENILVERKKKKKDLFLDFIVFLCVSFLNDFQQKKQIKCSEQQPKLSEIYLKR